MLGSLTCDCGDQLGETLKRIEESGEGVVLYMRQEGRGIGLLNKIKAYALQQEGLDTVEANIELGFSPDLREYDVASQMLKLLGVDSVNLITNNPAKVEGLVKYGIKVENRSEIVIEKNGINNRYIDTKAVKMKHIL